MLNPRRWRLAIVALWAPLALPAIVDAQAYYGGYDGGYQASTAAEGYQQGMASVVRAQGAKNLEDSRAAINVEAARSANTDNKVQATSAYWERKQIYEEATAPQRYAEEQKREEHRDRTMLKSLSPSELDPTTGDVSWPPLMKDKNFSEYRDPLNKLFAKQAADGTLTGDEYLQAKKLIKDCRAAVTAERGTYPDDVLSPTLRFLLKLNRELDANFG